MPNLITITLGDYAFITLGDYAFYDSKTTIIESIEFRFIH